MTARDARPVVWLHMDTLAMLAEGMRAKRVAVERLSDWDNKKNHVALYTATDYEALRARVEAAEARVGRLIEIGQRILMNPNVQKQLSYLRDGIGTATENRVWWDLESALNDQGQGNG